MTSPKSTKPNLEINSRLPANMSHITFYRAFQALTNHKPLGWQGRAFGRMLYGEIPDAFDLSTGLGKTSVIPIWLIALCHQAVDRHITLPRILAYIVNRRTVVDQATSVVEAIRNRILYPDNSAWSGHSETLEALAGALKLLSPSEACLAVSTLRGELADNEEWKTDPARAAIIVGTIDMVGSKLLFNGYGDSSRVRPRSAGLIGQDTLIVHDEAHLTPAFSKLLRDVRKAQTSDADLRPIRVTELSATQRDADGLDDVLELLPEEMADPIVNERVNAVKLARLYETDDRAISLVAGLSERALRHKYSQAKVLVYVQTPKLAQDVAKKLISGLGKGSDDRVALLTGTMRGSERDRMLADDPVYKTMLDSDAIPMDTVYLVSTSAGEVGIDLDADHIVCDLTTLDSMIQRLGRVNRRGGADRTAEIDVVWQPKQATLKKGASPFDKSLANTLSVLDRWAGSANGAIDVSPANLRKLIDSLSSEDRKAAFFPNPPILATDDILFDDWSMTSVSDVPGRPDVGDYLHGREPEHPQTYIAWRDEVPLFGKHAPEDADDLVSAWFRICRIRSNERISAPTDAARRFLLDLLKEHRKKDTNADFHVALLNARLESEYVKLSQLADSDRQRLNQQLNYKTVVLPVDAGGLDEHGMLDAKSNDTVEDVADSPDPVIGRKRVLPDQGSGDPPENWNERGKVVLKHADDESGEGGDTAKELILYMPSRQATSDEPEFAKFDQTLTEHTKLIKRHMRDICDRLSLPTEIVSALVLAAEWHDKGKDRDIWQRFASNRDGDNVLAKSRNYCHPNVLAGYRHELGSLLDALKDESVIAHPESDLILHLVASHHGNARPSFRVQAFDRTAITKTNETANFEAMRRFARLQRRFGRWGLAWLEALLHSADVMASQPDLPQKSVEDNPASQLDTADDQSQSEDRAADPVQLSLV